MGLAYNYSESLRSPIFEKNKFNTTFNVALGITDIEVKASHTPGTESPRV